MERKYKFREKAKHFHPKDIYDKNTLPAENEIEIDSGYTIVIPKDCDIVLKTASKDLAGYFSSAFGIKLKISNIAKSEKLIEYIITGEEEKRYSIKAGKKGKITLSGSSSRLTAQAGYLLEKLLTARRAPFVEIRNEIREPMFSPRMVHSGIGLDIYPDYYLQSIAHEGMDAIIIFVTAPNKTPYGDLDFNDLCDRAAKYGIDVYAYSYMKNKMHPDEKGAEEYYDKIYGNLFRKCPGLAGIIFVGESCEFPSHDRHTTGELRAGRNPWGQDKPYPGWWPCSDYPKWIDIVKKTIRKESPDADFVFWSYNWGWAPEKYRLSLIRSLPTDISLLVTFEMFEDVKRGSHTARTVDYSLFFEGPGKYFLSEAEEAKKRGIRLYAMTNTGGLTWDCGTVPYEPFVDQWIRRFSAVRECNEKYGLCGLMESHHFGFTPSITSALANEYYSKTGCKRRARKRTYETYFGKEYAQDGKELLKRASEGVRYLISTEHDQYGPMRVGAAYPLVLEKDIDFVFKSEPTAHFGGNEICDPTYDYNNTRYGYPKDPAGELHCFEKASKLILSSAFESKKLSEKIKDDATRDRCNEIAQILEYIGRSALCTVHVKKFKALKEKLLSEENAEDKAEIAKEMKKTALKELDNSVSLLSVVKENSRLGFEPSMEYMGDAEHIEIKISQVRKMIKNELDPIIKQN